MKRHLLFCGALLGLALATPGAARPNDNSILPREWKTDLSTVGDWLERALHEAEAQQAMNQLSRCLADLRDAQLLAVYVRLFEKLDVKERAALLAEQEQWLGQRAKAAAAGVASEGGSLAPTEANLAEADFTQRRISALGQRLAARTKARP